MVSILINSIQGVLILEIRSIFKILFKTLNLVLLKALLRDFWLTDQDIKDWSLKSESYLILSSENSLV